MSQFLNWGNFFQLFCQFFEWDSGHSVTKRCDTGPFPSDTWNKIIIKKSWEKFPIQKLWRCDTIILCPVSHWKGQVSGLKIIEKNIFGTLWPVSHSKKLKKKLGKIPNSKIVTLWHDYFMPGVTLKGSSVTSENDWKKYFWDTGTSVPFEKLKKNIGKITTYWKY